MSKSGGNLGAQAHPIARDDALKARSVPVLAPRERKIANQRTDRIFSLLDNRAVFNARRRYRPSKRTFSIWNRMKIAALS
ncbi:MAG: hypothetical protein JF594_03930 [Rhizobium leguminosarum]|nr:hypothetical protein [Rhizobium leguminosarum]